MPFDSTDFPFAEKGIADYATTGSGVYGICNATDWTYIGEAKDVEAGLYAHLRGESDQSACILRQKPTTYAFERCDAITRMTREKALLRELDPICNRT